MKPEEWASEIKANVLSGKWDSIEEIRQETNQRFAASCDSFGAREFYEECLELGLATELLEKVRAHDKSQLQEGLSSAFLEAKDKLRALDAIKGVYVEYFFDGGDSCTANIFLCTDYSEEDDYWGSEFPEEGFVEGPSINEFLNFNPDFDFDEISEVVANEYGNAMIMSECLAAWASSGITGLPLGFANHDYKMVRSPALQPSESGIGS